ncbi:hypothetical protein [Paraclostridium dentum]|uniref:hypothetical protein n=1 Tax=Paraclostridium dentum TaxID=2662455 RepID=UPI003F339057
MLETLLLIAIAIIGTQAIVIALLVNLVNKTRENKESQKKEARKTIQGLIKLSTELENELDDYKEAYYKCYAEYKTQFAVNKEIRKQLEYVEELHSHMVNNMHTLLKQSRVIKSRYMDNVIPYKSFGNLSDADRKELFGA